MRRWPERVLAIAFASLVSPAAIAQPYPSQDIHFISGFAAGSGSDVMVRYFAEKIRPLAGRTIIVENKSGANGVIAIEYTARAKPDGYTILVHAGSGIGASQALMKNPPFDAGTQLRIAATINRQAFMLAVPANSPYQTLADLTAAMKAKGNKASFASNSTQSRIAGALYKKAAGLDAVEVRYSTGANTLREMMSGVIDYSFQDPQSAMTQAQQGRFRLLAVCSATRLEFAPQLPTMAELGYPDFNLIGWFAATVPAAVPDAIASKINDWFAQVLATKESKDFLVNFGSDVWISKPSEGQAFFIKDLQTWRENVAMAGIEQQ